jgi:hypothetical protein
MDLESKLEELRVGMSSSSKEEEDYTNEKKISQEGTYKERMEKETWKYHFSGTVNYHGETTDQTIIFENEYSEFVELNLSITEIWGGNFLEYEDEEIDEEWVVSFFKEQEHTAEADLISNEYEEEEIEERYEDIMPESHPSFR